MASLNKVLLMGNLTRDPELRYTPGGVAICQFGMAVNRRFKTSNGEGKAETCYIDILVWGSQGENVERYLKKGSPVFIEGRLQMDQWEDKESGAKRSKLQVVAESVQFISSHAGSDRDDFEPMDDARGRSGDDAWSGGAPSPMPSRNAPPRRENSNWNAGSARRPSAPQGRPAPAFDVDQPTDDSIPF